MQLHRRPRRWRSCSRSRPSWPCSFRCAPKPGLWTQMLGGLSCKALADPNAIHGRRT